MLNPGAAAADHKVRRMELGRDLRSKSITYEQYNEQLAELVPQWGFGGILRWLRALDLEPERIAFCNIALCAVEGDEYFPQLFKACFERHSGPMLATLQPDVVLLCGKKQLAPYVAPIGTLGTKVILTWHDRPMHTSRGKAELRRVRRELDKITK